MLLKFTKTEPSKHGKLQKVQWTNLLKAGLLALFNFAVVAAFGQQAQTVSTPEQMVGALHSAFGKHPNARAVHTKGIILTGDFSPSKEARTLTKASHFQGAKVPVIFRFSDFTGIPNIADTTGLSNPRGLAIKFELTNGKSTDIVGHSFNGFPTSTTDEFRELLMAVAASGPQAPHPNAIESFLGSHPVAKTFLTTQKPPSVSFATLTYFGVNAFKFTNAKGDTTFIRYQFVPVIGEQFLSAEQRKQAGPDYLFTEIKSRIAKGEIKFKMYAQVAEPGDNITNPSVAWPDDRKRVYLGLLKITKLASNTLAEDKALVYNPGNLNDGIAGADNMIADRHKLYPVSVKERQQ